MSLFNLRERYLNVFTEGALKSYKLFFKLSDQHYICTKAAGFVHPN